MTQMTLLSALVELARHRHAEAGRDRGRGMRGTERVEFALGALGEAGEAAALAQGADAVAPSGEDLVRIALMADVPDQAVVRRVEGIVQRHRQLDDAEPGAEMASGLRHRVDEVVAQLIGDLAKAAGLELAQILGGANLVEQGGLRWLVHRLPPYRPVGRCPRRCGKIERLCSGSILFRVHAPNGLKHIAGERQFT